MPTAPPSAIRLAPSANRVRVERPVVVRKIIDASPFRAISRPRRALEHGRTGGPISPASAVRGRKDRKSVVSGKSVSVRVDLGGRRILKKKKKLHIKTQ